MVWKRVSGFCHQLPLKLSTVRRKRSKNTWLQDYLFHFQIFETFAYLGIDSSVNLNKGFWTVLNTFHVTLVYLTAVYLTFLGQVCKSNPI